MQTELATQLFSGQLFPLSAVNTSNSTAVSNTFELQKPNPALRIREGLHVSLIVIFLSLLRRRENFHALHTHHDIPVCDAQSPRHPRNRGQNTRVEHSP